MPATTQVQRVVSRMLAAMGLQDITDADASQQGDLLSALEAGIEEIAQFPTASWWGTNEFAGILPAPTAITSIMVTAGSKAATSAELTGNKVGQAATISGDSVMNRIIGTGLTGIELLIPYGGTTGTTTGVLHYDTMALPSDFLRFKGDLTQVGGDRITMVSNQAAMGSPRLGTGAYPTGTPTRARMVSRIANTTGLRMPFLQFDCLPTVQLRYTGEYFCRPAPVESLTAERNDLVPANYYATVLVPICLHHLSILTDSAVVTEKAIGIGYESALRILNSIADQEGYVGDVAFENGLHN